MYPIMSKFQIHYNKKKNTELFSYFSDLSENKIKKMQNYIPIYSKFFSLNPNNYNDINLNHHYSIEKIEEIYGENDFSICVKTDKEQFNKKSFFKYSPLLDTSKFMVGKYKGISKNVLENLPKISDNKETILKKIICQDNAAYTDSFFSYLSSKILHNHSFVHGIDFYGSFLGIKDKLKIDITDDLEYLYDYDFFHENNNILFDTDKINEALMDDDTRKNRNAIKIENEAVLGANVVLTGSTKIIDVSGQKPVEHKGIIPSRSVVIPGTYNKEFSAGKYGVPCALIIGKRKQSTDKKTSLNNALRDYNVSI